MTQPVSPQAFLATVPESRAFEIEFVRNLIPTDEIAANYVLPKSDQPVAMRLRTSHHKLAKCIADGMTSQQAHIATGYSPSYISIVLHDPAFADLVAYYQTQALDSFKDVHERIATLGVTALEILQERIETEGDKLGIKTLKEIAEFSFDRGLAPSKAANRMGGGTGAPVSVTVSFLSPGPQNEPAKVQVNDSQPIIEAEIIGTKP